MEYQLGKELSFQKKSSVGNDQFGSFGGLGLQSFNVNNEEDHKKRAVSNN